MKKRIIFLIVLTLLFVEAALNITAAKNYKGAEYRTIEEFVYGRFEVRYKPAHREGVISSFFTYHEFTNQTGWNEIDIEFVGRNEYHIQFNTITPGQKFHIRNQPLAFNPYIDFHTYAFEWTPEYIAWFVDGEEVYRQTQDFISTVVHPQKLMMNIWNPVYTNWVGYWDDSALPSHSIYDWTSYSLFTPGTGNTGTGNNFTFQWKDDFDEFDDSRWQKATHTFGGNQCDFIQENAVFKDGYLYLCLTDPDNIGLVDVNPPRLKWVRENYDNTITVMFSEELDEVSSQNTANYIIPGVTVTNAKLSDDRKSVSLTTQNYDTNITYNVIVMNVLDDTEPPNKMSTRALSIIQIDPLEFPFKVNVGGNAFGDYAGDQEWNENVEYGYLMGDIKTYPANLIINGTTDHKIFQDERKGLACYKVHVPNGLYKVNILFAENDERNSTGDRVFDVFIENQIVADKLDIFNEVGIHTVYNLELTVTIEDEVIDIYFGDQVDSSFVNAVVIEQISTSVDERSFGANPSGYRLLQNYPNPFNGETIIKFSLPEQQKADLIIYDILGSEVYRNNLGTVRAGNNSTTWNAVCSNGRDINSGIYFYQIAGENFSITKKLVYLK